MLEERAEGEAEFEGTLAELRPAELLQMLHRAPRDRRG